jgi:enamine deaminase RidA (YjgF/YER057c/UK114 family)
LSVEHVNAPELPKPHGYSYAVVATGSRIVHLSGQVSVDGDGNLVGEGDLAVQARQAMVNLAAAVRATGADVKEIVKLNLYVVDFNPDREREMYKGLGEAAEETGMGRTATTLISVPALGIPGALIEIDGVAVTE